jgi:adenosine deaminase CECR1
MTVADSPKKRKRAISPLPARRIPIHFEEPKDMRMAPDPAAVVAAFDKALGNVDRIKKYADSHGALIAEEESDVWDRGAKLGITSSKDVETEKRAATVIRAIREYERKTVFGNLASETIPGPETRDMGGQFLTNKERIDLKSLLYQIAIRVPKGGLLHLHFNSELHPERLLARARLIDNLYIRSIRPLQSREDLNETEMVFNVLHPNMVEKGVDIFSPKYPGTATNWRDPKMQRQIWMPWKPFCVDFVKHFPNLYVQEEKKAETPRSCSDPVEPGNFPLDPAENWLKSKMVLSEMEAYRLDQTVNG